MSHTIHPESAPAAGRQGASRGAAREHRSEASLPAYQAFMILRGAFTVAPILFGVDKFFHLMVNWDIYLAPAFANLSPFSVHTSMDVVGVIEIAAGLLVAARPKLGAPVVALWLLGIIVNLLLIPGYDDVALRDFGLLLAAGALSRLAVTFDLHPLPWRRTP